MKIDAMIGKLDSPDPPSGPIVPVICPSDEWLSEHVSRGWRENREVYGIRKVWTQPTREGQPSRAVP